jgi:hypothetical protein
MCRRLCRDPDPIRRLLCSRFVARSPSNLRPFPCLSMLRRSMNVVMGGNVDDEPQFAELVLSLNGAQAGARPAKLPKRWWALCQRHP